MLVPYKPDHEGRENHGFRDLRGRPDAAAQIPEAQHSAPLRALLVALAEPGAPFFTVGCDAGSGQHKPDEGHAGGYVQVVFADSRNAAWLGVHKIAAHQLRACLGQAVANDTWDVNLTIARVGLESLGGPYIGFSLVIEYAAIARTEAEAGESNDRLLAAMLTALMSGLIPS